MDITVLIENTVNKSTNLITEPGLSLYIEKDNKFILFDTGKSDNFIDNAEKLKIDIKNIDIVVLSHGHNDHGGGLESFLKENTKAKVYMKRFNMEGYYFRCMCFNHNVGINNRVFNDYSNRINYIDNFTEILKDVYIFTDIEKKYPIPKGNKYLYTVENQKLVRDTFKHELIMVVKDINGISIFTGCSHNGTANIIETVRNIFLDIHIKALIGGFHLIRIPLIKFLSASKDEIDILTKIINEENIEKIYTGHCTGKIAYQKLKNILGDKIEYLSTGNKIHV